MSKQLPFAIRIARMSDGEKIEHFKTIFNRMSGQEVKIFNTSKKVFVVSISACRKDVEVVCLIRRKNTALLPIEACIQTCINQGISIGAISVETGLTVQREAA
jgi:hypothetical protein